MLTKYIHVTVYLLIFMSILCESSTIKFRRTYEEPLNSWFTSKGNMLPASDTNCYLLLVESIPENLTYTKGSPHHLATYFAWKMLLESAQTNLEIASFYWSLLPEKSYNSSSLKQGADIFKRIGKTASNISVNIAQNGAKSANIELEKLQTAGAHIQWVDVTRLIGRGILHTKLWLVDNTHAYLGSANMDWRSLTQVKEMGVLMLNCPTLVQDLQKIWQVYWYLGGPNTTIPTEWPTELHTQYNRTNPIVTYVNGIKSRVYFSSSPPLFNPPGRNDDLDALLSVIESAVKYIYISVMDYTPKIISYNKKTPHVFWPIIDDALRKASIERKVEVRLLISRWKNTPAHMANYLNSLRALDGADNVRLRIRYFVVPAYNEFQRTLPYSRVNHNKYMVTDNKAYIGTSNWSGEYFLFTGGASIVLDEDKFNEEENSYMDDLQGEYSTPKPTTIRTKLKNVFIRDWNSEFAYEL